jgi:hypothetical protein
MISENTCEAFMNDEMEEYEINPSFQTKSSQKLQSEEKTMKINIKKLHVQRTMWKSHGIICLHCVFFRVNDNKDVDVKCSQTMLAKKTILEGSYLVENVS